MAFKGTGILYVSATFCSLPNHPCHSSCLCSCCEVCLCCLNLSLYQAVHGFFAKATGLVFILFTTRGCWKVFLYGCMFQIYVKSTN